MAGKKHVTYDPKGKAIILIADGVGLRFGRTVYRDRRWVASRDVFKMLRAQNPDVEFRKKG